MVGTASTRGSLCEIVSIRSHDERERLLQQLRCCMGRRSVNIAEYPNGRDTEPSKFDKSTHVWEYPNLLSSAPHCCSGGDWRKHCDVRSCIYGLRCCALVRARLDRSNSRNEVD